VLVLKSLAILAKAGKYKSIANGLTVDNDPKIQIIVRLLVFVLVIKRQI
jgi:hypothetical protein